MALDIVMPALSPTMESGTLARWLVKVGDAVVPGDVIAEVETDKATMEIEAVDAGVIRSLLVADGTEDVPVGEVIARIGENGEVAHDMPSSMMAGPTSEDAPADAVEVVVASKPSDVLAEATDGRDLRYGGELTVASPLAAKLARARGISLAAIVGTGPNGRIVKADIIPQDKVVLTATISQTRTPARVIANDPVPADIPMRAVKLSSMRRTIARRLTKSKQTVPHFYLTVDVDLDSLLTLRTQLNAAAAEGHPKISVNDLIIRALGVALMEVPEANVQYTEDQLYFFNRADIAVAVAVDGGLITPVVRDAGSKSASAIAREMKRLAESARAGLLQPDEYQGGTASLSNLGMYGIKQFDAVINPPQAMILAMGVGEQRSVVRGGELAIATVASITGSFDHRAIDGAVGASMMAALKRLIEAPLTMLA